MNNLLFKPGIICTNCEEKGHTTIVCRKPVCSDGIIAFKRTKNGLKFLLIQRKDTIAYIDFVRGKYNLANPNQLSLLIEEMIPEEKNNLLTLTFDEIWSKLWMNHQSRAFLYDYKDAKEQYYKLDIKHLLQNSVNCKWEETEIEYPKGRRFNKETHIACAKREFAEETGYKESEFRILDIPPLEEIFYGSNSVSYKHIYYIAEITTSRIPEIDNYSIQMAGEIKALNWMNFKDSINSFRNYSTGKRNVLYTLRNLLN